jgi:hypothetical protein
MQPVYNRDIPKTGARLLPEWNSMTIFRWIPRVLAIAGVLTGVVGCGGGGDSSVASATARSAESASASTQATEGLWTGTLRAGDTGQAQSVVILSLPSGETRLVANNCLAVIAFTQNNGQAFSGGGNAYAPNSTLATCAAHAMFTDGSTLATASINGRVVPQQSLTGTLSAAGSTSTLTASYNTAYNRSGELSRLAGTYVNGSATIQVDANGSISGSLGGYFLSGTASVISPTKDAWYLQIQQYTVGYTGAVATPVNGPKWSGAATLIDSPARTDGELVVSLSNADAGFGATLTRQ